MCIRTTKHLSDTEHEHKNWMNTKCNLILNIILMLNNEFKNRTFYICRAQAKRTNGGRLRAEDDIRTIVYVCDIAASINSEAPNVHASRQRIDCVRCIESDSFERIGCDVKITVKIHSAMMTWTKKKTKSILYPYATDRKTSVSCDNRRDMTRYQHHYRSQLQSSIIFTCDMRIIVFSVKVNVQAVLST